MPILAMMLVLASCENINIADLNSKSGKTSAVRVVTRSSQQTDLSYPIHIFAFSTTGSLITSQQLKSASDELKLSLPQQTQCRIVAISADETVYDVPSSPSLSSVITMKAPTLSASASSAAKSIAKGYGATALQMGTADITPMSDNATITLLLNYQVASLDVTLCDLPADCSNAYISVASPYNSVALNGAFDGTQTSCIPLTSGGSSQWKSGTVYLFPTSGNTTFTIAYSDANGEHYAAVNYLSSLVAGTPYTLNGKFVDGALHVTGAITPSAWSDPVDINFSFNDGGSTSVSPDGTTDESDEDAIGVSAIPQPLSIWNGHIVAAVSDMDGNPLESTSATSATLLLLSLTDYAGLTSALNTDNPNAAQSLASAYSEYDFNDSWRIPTDTEASRLRSACVADVNAFNQLLTEAQADPIVLADEKGNNLRYLCADARKTFSFKEGSSYNSIKDAGATVKNYRLRLVRTVRVKVSK